MAIRFPDLESPHAVEGFCVTAPDFDCPRHCRCRAGCATERDEQERFHCIVGASPAAWRRAWRIRSMSEE